MNHFFTKTQEPYALLLTKQEWYEKRNQILARDKYRCRVCSRSDVDNDIILQVHHKYYVEGLDPWEYRDSALVTLCEECHQKLHRWILARGEKIPCYQVVNGSLVEIELTPCSRCNGAGYFPEYQHVWGGLCFRCRGARYDEITSVVELWENEHGADLGELVDGFIPISEYRDRFQGSPVEYISVEKGENTGKLYASLLLENGFYRSAILDHSVDAAEGDRLDMGTARFRKTSIGIIIKGTKIYKD